ncbi:MAG: RsmB/NOP family class I SAM-dependent RNA methyltransferase [Porphyromonadaceae bacterium]|nr:RsmB/NOP family class I SAM-dependent RNA methyltransferase [Porphyromonadaceae bacterium]
MNLPADFIHSVRGQLGEETEPFLSVLAEDTPVSIHLNPFKRERNLLAFIQLAERVPWSEQGYYLAERPSFTFDPLFHTGYYYVQEASSMFIEHVVKKLVSAPVTCLDLCAAPGGKSVGLLSALPAGSLLVSNEVVRQRANVLSETLIKFGHPNTMVTQNSAKDFAAFPGLFDLILVDAPCSGEGMFRKDEAAVQEWSPQNVKMCAARQKEILGDVWPALKPGGWMVYSTCTYNSEENEENMRWAANNLDAIITKVEVDAAWNIAPSYDEKAGGHHFYPHKVKGEGLFVAVLQKPEVKLYEVNLHSKKNKKQPTLFIKDPADYAALITNLELYHLMESGDRITALPKIHAETIVLLMQNLKCISVGIELGEKRGKDFIPAHALAMSNALNRKRFFTHEVTYEQAIAYLRREAISLPCTPRGMVLLTWQNEPLGFVKNIGNRANNLYPNEWRIRSGYLPEKKPEILAQGQSVHSAE